jgi:hypothetical protein
VAPFSYLVAVEPGGKRRRRFVRAMPFRGKPVNFAGELTFFRENKQLSFYAANNESRIQ